ncbi:MAG TPA: glucose 1-dehydrogenase [Planctomycetota bacterium]|nr:glucose 1-dehydrogenase [Planctomycetota bacterium]
MKAIAVKPGQPNSVHLTELEKPAVDAVANGRGVLVEVLEVGVDGTDKEINEALYGNAPEGFDFLVLGHESFGRVVEVGPNVRELVPGDLVAATVRRPGRSLYDQIGTYDMTTDTKYWERGISYLHGFLTEYYVDEPEYLIRVPSSLAHVGVLMEPVSVVEKGLAQAWEIQRRLKVWEPRRAAVMGAGTIGQLATLILRMRGLEVVTVARTPGPHLKSQLVEEIGASYVSSKSQDIRSIGKEHGPFDLVFEATGNSEVAFRSLEILAKNGILVLTSITGGDAEVTIPADRINLDFVLYNKVMVGTVNAHRGYFEMGVQDFALAESMYPGWLSKLLTNRVDGLDNYRELFRQLVDDRRAIKVYLGVKSV